MSEVGQEGGDLQRGHDTILHCCTGRVAETVRQSITFRRKVKAAHHCTMVSDDWSLRPLNAWIMFSSNMRKVHTHVFCGARAP